MTQPESKLSQKIQQALKGRGAYVWKVHGNELTPAGTPDIVGVYRGHFIAVETKMPGNKLSAVQAYRITRMRNAGALVVAPCYTVAAALDLLNALDHWQDGKGLAVRTARYLELINKYGISATAGAPE